MYGDIIGIINKSSSTGGVVIRDGVDTTTSCTDDTSCTDRGVAILDRQRSGQYRDEKR
jgi:hypothetical protein